MITVNGREFDINEQQRLSEFLNQEGFETLRIAVERNGEIVPKSAYDKTVLNDHDTLEVVSFVGGG
ncbi:MAG: sulfur carrier protein ThiS [Eubacterium sp.]